MYFQSRKLTNVIILLWREIHSFVSINIATKHPRALICVYNRIGRTHMVVTKESGTIARETGSPFVQFISREISQATSSLTFSIRNSILETRDSVLETQDSILETIGDRVLRLEVRGLRDCQLTFERYCIFMHIMGLLGVQRMLVNLRVRLFAVVWIKISNTRSVRSWYIKGAGESMI